MPVVSPSGKYWVKVLFMGRERLVEIDDRMPCDKRKKQLFPRTVEAFEIWPQLMLKAYLKVYPHTHLEEEIGDGRLIYAFTGLIPERVRLDELSDESTLDLFRKLLSDDHYFNRRTFVTCFCENEYKPSLPSQKDLPRLTVIEEESPKNSPKKGPTGETLSVASSSPE